MSICCAAGCRLRPLMAPSIAGPAHSWPRPLLARPISGLALGLGDRPPLCCHPSGLVCPTRLLCATAAVRLALSAPSVTECRALGAVLRAEAGSQPCSEKGSGGRAVATSSCLHTLSQGRLELAAPAGHEPPVWCASVPARTGP